MRSFTFAFFVSRCVPAPVQAPPGTATRMPSAIRTPRGGESEPASWRSHRSPRLAASPCEQRAQCPDPLSAAARSAHRGATRRLRLDRLQQPARFRSQRHRVSSAIAGPRASHDEPVALHAVDECHRRRRAVLGMLGQCFAASGPLRRARATATPATAPRASQGASATVELLAPALRQFVDQEAERLQSVRRRTARVSAVGRVDAGGNGLPVIFSTANYVRPTRSLFNEARRVLGRSRPFRYPASPLIDPSPSNPRTSPRNASRRLPQAQTQSRCRTERKKRDIKLRIAIWLLRLRQPATCVSW